jgi:L-glyceraldehyde 3-phosphate reductase
MIDRTSHNDAEREAREKPELPAEVSQPFYWAAEDRYEKGRFRYVGNSGLQLSAISLGLWHNFGDDTPFARQRAVVRKAFDLGITQFDLANNYGPPYGSAEENFGRIFAKDLAPYRDELVITTKAGWDMWPGPYGWGGARKHVLASLEASLERMGLDHVDIFYSHRIDLDTPLEETMGALATAVHQGKARYVGISSYSPARTAEAARILRELGTPLLIHQPNYSMFNRWIEAELLDVLEAEGAGCIPFSPLAQGLLTDKYLDGVPDGSRATQGKSLFGDQLSDENLERVRALNEIAQRRGQSLAQMAIAWVLRDPRVSSALIGASSPAQLEDSVGALEAAPFSKEELAEIDRYAQPGAGVDLWNVSAGL